MSTRGLLTLASLLLAILFAVAAPVAGAAEDPFSPALRKAMTRQDDLTSTSDFETLLEEAQAAASADTADAHYLHGRALGILALQAMGRADTEQLDRMVIGAQEAFEKAKEAGGFLYPLADLGLGRCRMLRGEVDEAEAHLRKAIEIAGPFQEAIVDLASVLWRKGLQRDAEFELHRFLEGDPNDLTVRMLLGQFKYQRRRWAEAEAEFATVIRKDPQRAEARKLLAATVMFQERHAEAAELFERVRAESPKEDDVYVTLFHIYRKLREREKALAVLRDLIVQLPGTEAARRAQERLKEIEADPKGWAEEGRTTRETLIARLDSPDSAVVERALHEMGRLEWTGLPGAVYRQLDPGACTPGVRAAAVRLIGQVGDARTFTILEILLFHPAERDPDAAVRREAARAIAKLPTKASIFTLYTALDSPDAQVREAAVQGIAALTGRWFRRELDVETPAAEWPAELERYRAWWSSGSASIVKRSAVEALAGFYEKIGTGRRRVSGYLLEALDDANPRTWKVGYDLFRKWNFVSFGHDDDESVSLEDRRDVARQARLWLKRRLEEGK